MRQPAGYAAKTSADSFYRQLEQECSHGGSQHGHNRSGNPVGNRAAQQDHSHRAGRKQGGLQRPRGRGGGKSLHSQPEFAGNLVQVQAEKIFDLGARDQDRDAVGKSDYDRARNKLHRCAHTGCAQDDEYRARHDRTHVQAVDAVYGDDAGDDDDKCTCRPADLSLRSAQSGDQEPGHDGAIDAGLRCQPGSDRERHGQRQCHQADRDPGNHVMQKFVEAIVAQAQDGLGKPAVVQL